MNSLLALPSMRLAAPSAIQCNDDQHVLGAATATSATKSPGRIASGQQRRQHTA
eukprot:CAMPEP_0179161818 /NCGR_PEP_ID=MMETSP0796-20121207/79235_1 /TAXON_ID=73915 /ORGANISM="Pyrodinium bahamense, Strain pbaha01" /LENGTH=53 /DNA_ID=CAMNT_0020863959 /DNA_START=264 /DNA_END=421 /DNA_ORIENTATION=+